MRIMRIMEIRTPMYISSLTKTAFLAACLALFSNASAHATLVAWSLNPDNLNQDLNTNTAAFTVAGYTITARGYDNWDGNGHARDLHYKWEGADEFGLGLRGTPNNELQVNGSGMPLNFIQLDLRSILLQGFTGGQIEVGSVQSGESFDLYGSNTLGQLGTKINGAAYGHTYDLQFVSVPNFGSYGFLSVVAHSGDLLPVAFQANIVPIPEMGSLIPAACLAIVVTAFEARRRKRDRIYRPSFPNV